MSQAKVVSLHALTPLHVGTGQAVANLDLPIAREKATGFPMVPASSFKGVLRDYLRGSDWVDDAFGYSDKAGAFVFTDLRLLCLPVRSYFGTFAYVTCPLVLQRYNRMVGAFGAGQQIPDIPDISDGANSLRVALCDGSVLSSEGRVYLEDLDLEVDSIKVSQVADVFAKIFCADQPRLFTERFAIVSDSTFSFLAETATEVVARVRLQDDTKTVASGALWYEEALPAESLLYGFIGLADYPRSQNTALLDNLPSGLTLQIGGDATIGRGVCKVVIQ